MNRQPECSETNAARQVRQRLDSAAAAQSRPLNDIVSELLSAALDTTTNQTTTTPRASNDATTTLDMFGNPEPATMDNTFGG
jgi:hypothetical protein